MTGVLPTATDPAMQALGLSQVAASLQQAQLASGIAVEADRLQALSVARHGRILQAQVNSDRLLRRHGRLFGDFHGQAQPPVPHGVLRKAALLPLHPVQALGLKHAEGLPAETQGMALAFQARGLEW